jgi:hypothetical protein
MQRKAQRISRRKDSLTQTKRDCFPLFACCLIGDKANGALWFLHTPWLNISHLPKLKTDAYSATCIG